ncbi:MAG: amidohydrolase family protein [Candidatus Hodarchaeales archaeon]
MRKLLPNQNAMYQNDSKFDISSFDYFDSHVHLFPSRLFNALWSYFENNYWPIYRKGSPESLVRSLISEYNVKHFVILNYAHKKGIAQSLNNWTSDFSMSPECKGNAIPFGTIHPDDIDISQEMDRIFGELNFAGIKLQLMVTNFHIWDKRMEPVYQKILQYEKILLVHIGTGPSYSNYHPQSFLQCSHVGYKHFRRFIAKYPEINVIVPHLGADEYEKMWALAEIYPNLYFDTAMICAKDNTAFEDKMSLIDDEKLYAISDRILFGSDFPNIPYDFRNSVLGWLERDMESSFYRKIFSNNAKTLFKSYL